MGAQQAFDAACGGTTPVTTQSSATTDDTATTDNTATTDDTASNGGAGSFKGIEIYSLLLLSVITAVVF